VLTLSRRDARPATRVTCRSIAPVIALGFLVIIVGFALISARGTDSGLRSSRSVSIGRQWWSLPTRPDGGYDGTASRRYRLIRFLGGLVMIVGGFVIIAMS
jgi:hypothetical protein